MGESRVVEIKPELVKRLREMTGAGMMDCKRALEETGGDLERAVDLLRAQGKAAAKKRAGRSADEGLVDAYLHMNGRIGVLIEVNCETDFVAKTDEFRTLARELAMQVAASAPLWVSRDDVPQDELDRERKVFEEQARGKPERVVTKIVEGKLEAFYKERCLLDQPWIRDDAKTIDELIHEASAKLGEKIQVRRFARFALGEVAP